MPPTTTSFNAAVFFGAVPTRIAARRVFLGLLIVNCLLHAMTLTRSPIAWQDEIQIIDYGRTLVPGSDQSYGVSWSTADRPLRPLCYIGCLIQEAAYRLGSGSMAGPRMSGLIGSMIAAAALRCWLLAAGISPWVAFVASCSFLWDPLVVSGYRGARVDVWCMAAMFGALWCVRKACGTDGPRPLLGVAGVLVALSGLIWPSAILMVPLLVYEIFASTAASSAGRGTRITDLLTKKPFESLLVLGLSAAVAMLLLLLPYYGALQTMVADLHGSAASNVTDDGTRLVARAIAVFGLFVSSPWLPLVALAGVAALGPRSWFLPLAAAVSGVIVTRSYGHRAVYLIPYFTYGFAMAMHAVFRSSQAPCIPRKSAAWLAAIVLIWGAGISLVARTLNAANDWGRRDPALAERFIDDLVGESSTNVLLESWNLYYPIRSRGWRYWGPYDLRTTADVATTLDYDYVIHDESAGVHRLDGVLREAGYRRRVVSLQGGRSPETGDGMVRNPEYGPYVVYTHPDLTTNDRAAE